MKSLRRSMLFVASFTLVAFFAITYTSCRKDKCKDVVCENDGICDGGVCWCSLGFDGDHCENISRDKFIGTWHAEGTAGEAATMYTIIIAGGNQVNNVFIKNFNNSFSKNVVAYVSKDSLVIPRQLLEARVVQGAGYFTNDSDIPIHYDIIDSATNVTTSYNTTWRL